MANLKFSRRALIKKLGCSAALMPILEADKLFAQDAPIKRMVCITMCNGVDTNDFHSFHGGNSQTLAPLKPWQDKVTTIRGLGLKAMERGQAFQGHSSHSSQLTGSYRAATASIDQIVSDYLADNGVVTAHRKLNLGVRSERDGANTSYRGGGLNSANPNEINSRSLFNTLFESASIPISQLDAISARKASILDFLGRDLEKFGKNLGREDNAKIQAHLASVRELEKLLSVSSNACTAPDELDLSQADVQARFDAVSRMIGVALRCDLTRVITYEMYDNGGGNGNTFPWLSVGDYHEAAHAGLGGANGENKRKIDAWQFEQIAKIVKELSDTPEGDSTALDNSVIYIGNDMGEGHAHDTRNVSFATIGSCAGALRTGIAISKGNANPHNWLLTSVVQAMGVNTNQVGQDYSGNLPELMA